MIRKTRHETEPGVSTDTLYAADRIPAHRTWLSATFAERLAVLAPILVSYRNMVGTEEAMSKCPRCGYHAVVWDADIERWICYDCGWRSR